MPVQAEHASHEKPKEALAQAAHQSQWPKYAALFCVVLHQTSAVFTMRYSQVARRSAGRPAYLSTVAVFTTETAKLFGSFVAVAVEEGGIVAGCRAVAASFQGSLVELCRFSVPALLYSVQNNLLFIALANLSAAVYTVSYQIKTLTTALFSVVVLRRELNRTQWTSLVFLAVGVALLQLPSETLQSTSSSTTVVPQAAAKVGTTWVGMSAVLGAALTSGFCGVYMEKLLKQNEVSLWMRNVQLALVGAPVSLAFALWADYARIREDGFLQGYDGLVWSVVCINALGGLVIAAVLRYADNIVKCFATAAAVLVSCMLSSLMGELVLSQLFVVGTCLVACSSVMYGLGSDRQLVSNLRQACTDCSTRQTSRSRLVLVLLFISSAGACVLTVQFVAGHLEKHVHVKLPHQEVS